MRISIVLLFILFITSCSTEKPKFKKERVCSYEALRYLRNPRNKTKQRLHNPKLISDMASTARSMQLCYEDFRIRSGSEEFNTCLVVGIDDYGEMEFFNFGTREVQLDESFMRCAKAVTKSVPFSSYGTNYVLIQSYQFYVGN